MRHTVTGLFDLSPPTRATLLFAVFTPPTRCALAATIARACMIAAIAHDDYYAERTDQRNVLDAQRESRRVGSHAGV